MTKSPDITQLREHFVGPCELVKMSDGAVIFVRHWVPPSPISKTALLIFHGITAHSGPYGGVLAHEISNAGFNVYGMDLRGHGLSDGVRGDYPSEAMLIADLCETTEFIKSKASRVVVVGHSLGVLTAGILARNCLQKIDGLVLISAARKIKPETYPPPSTATKIRNLLALTLFKNRPMIRYSRAGMIGLDDPLFNFKYSARFLFIMYGVRGLSFARMMSSGELNSPNLNFPELQVPVWVGVGENDQLFSQEAAKSFFDGINCKNKEFTIIPGATHTNFPKGSWEPLIGWLNENFAESRTAIAR